MITFEHINTKSQLIAYKQNIASLFSVCFSKTLDYDLWEWLYLKNPVGSPLINLAFWNNELVGHYAFIPIKTNQYKTLLSITTMVSKTVRKYGVFYDLALKSYDFAQQAGYDLIIGFPNANAAPVHEKLLEWKLEKTFVIQIKDSYQNISENHQQIMLDLDNKDFLQWRLSKPNTHYFQENGNIFKTFQNGIDLVYLNTPKIEISENKSIDFCNILTQNKSLEQYKIFDYPFAYKILNPQIKNIFFKIDLLMSDIF